MHACLLFCGANNNPSPKKPRGEWVVGANEKTGCLLKTEVQYINPMPAISSQLSILTSDHPLPPKVSGSYVDEQGTRIVQLPGVARLGGSCRPETSRGGVRL